MFNSWPSFEYRNLVPLVFAMAKSYTSSQMVFILLYGVDNSHPSVPENGLVYFALSRICLNFVWNMGIKLCDSKSPRT